MGAWGTGILSDDTTRDVYDSYLDLFNRGNSPEASRTRILKDNAGILKDAGEGPLVWLAIAKAQWDCGQLEPEALTKVRKLVEDGLGLDRWREQGDRLLQQRKTRLNQFLGQLESDNLRPRKPRKATKRRPLFQPGDCLAVRREGGAWGALLVLQKEQESDDPYIETYGLNFVAVLRYKSAEPPGLSHFENRQWLSVTRPIIMEKGKYENQLAAYCLFPIRFNKIKERIVRIGNIPLRGDDPRENKFTMHTGWPNIIRLLG